LTCEAITSLTNASLIGTAFWGALAFDCYQDCKIAKKISDWFSRHDTEGHRQVVIGNDFLKLVNECSHDLETKTLFIGKLLETPINKIKEAVEKTKASYVEEAVVLSGSKLIKVVEKVEEISDNTEISTFQKVCRFIELGIKTIIDQAVFFFKFIGRAIFH